MDLTTRNENLPDTVEELHKFVLVGKEKLKAHKAKIRAIEKVELAHTAKEAALSDGQDIAEAILDAEAKLGEMLSVIPKQGKKKEYGSSGGTIPTLPNGITKKESHFAQTVAKNPETVAKVKAVAKEENRLPTTQDVLKEVKKEKQKKRQQEIIETPPPTGKYRTIVIDPPWPMQKILRDVRPNQDKFEYKTMTIDEIKGFNIPSDENCLLFMWTTQKHLPVAFEILGAWGFKYILTFVWHKEGGFQPFGLPQYNCEFVVFGKKGKIEFNETKNFFTCFNGKRREHSRKPIEFDDTIRRVCPEPRIDIFSREEKNGFDGFGNERTKF